jgi:hypothetical protein
VKYIQTLIVDTKLYETLVIDKPRSFKMDVWATPFDPNVTQSYEFKWLGVIIPNDHTDTVEIEMLVEEMIRKKQKLLLNEA